MLIIQEWVGTAKCAVCKKVISKDVLRIGKLSPFRGVYIKKYHHVSCTFAMFRRARLLSNIVQNENELDGFDNLTENDKLILRCTISEENSSRKPIVEREHIKKQSSKSVKKSGEILTVCSNHRFIYFTI